MSRIYSLLAYAALPLSARCALSATSQLFQLAGSTGGLNNVKLSWDLVDGAVAYNIQQKAGSGSYATVASAPGNGYDVYGLQGSSTFQIEAVDASNKTLDSSAELHFTAGANPSPELAAYDNTAASTLKIKSKIKGPDGTYYRHNYVTDANGFSHISQQTSADGYAFSGDTQVLARAEACASTGDGTCKLESISWAQRPADGRVFMWAHFERAGDYALGQVAVAYGHPGGGNLTFGGAFRPGGDDSRDMTFFADDDGAAYIACATHTNTDLGLYALSDDWTNVSSKVATLQPGEHREAPALFKVDGWYYVFTSAAAGWYASGGKYISAQKLAGPWSASRGIGNLNTFGAQSGQVARIGDAFVEVANRWAANWAHREAGNRQIVLPIAAAGGAAAYHFYHEVRYDDDTGVVVPVQSGRVLSVGRPASASVNVANASLANDGVQDREGNLFSPGAVPFWWEVDLGADHGVAQVDLTPRQVGGSETYVQYNVTGSADRKTWTTLVDEAGNQSPGFRTAAVSHAGRFRYVRVNVHSVVNVHNDDEADWAAGLHEVTVYGD
ncbi:hypothetical protein KVR01_003212 [Diaporthe batatas]|uniref:uncharacterized protein n=1 Tax=Diaporthe batatas TaxID=748121 RepID=UPI001D036996|nr:uncharacterized protein KVR01_003212 [Diaporthe batatas]KAG8167523.1 hypothetical protein KVR01_003212 [Diaporthe batatas]